MTICTWKRMIVQHYLGVSAVMIWCLRSGGFLVPSTNFERQKNLLMIVSDGDHDGSLDALNCKIRKQVTRCFRRPPDIWAAAGGGHLLWGKIASPQSFLEMLPQTYPEGHLLLMPHPLRLTIKPNHPNHQVHGAVWRQREG